MIDCDPYQTGHYPNCNKSSGLKSSIYGVEAQVLWFNPSQQLSNTQLLAHSLLAGWGKRIGRLKVRKLVCWDKF